MYPGWRRRDRFTFQIPYCLCNHSAAERFNVQREIRHEGHHAVAISFSGFIFAVGSIMQSLFRDVRPVSGCTMLTPASSA
jgi:hypothetical protein